MTMAQLSFAWTKIIHPIALEKEAGQKRDSCYRAVIVTFCTSICAFFEI